MRKSYLLAAAVFAACLNPQAVGSKSSAVEVPCLPAESFGAVADDGLDDRAALQMALSTGCLRLSAGRYDAVTPAWPRPVALLVTPPTGVRITGLGPQSRLIFSGEPAGQDWRGIQVRSNALISDVALSVEGMTGPTNEQTHVLRVDGPESDIAIDRVSIDHPVVPGGKRGDCIQLVGYPPGPSSPDKRIRNVRISHSEFLRCARSGIAVHSGLHGYAFSDNRFLGTADQDLDFEGTGDIIDGDVFDNIFEIPDHSESGISVSIMFAERLRFHHNSLNGRGLDLYGCDDCEIHHNRVIQSVPYTGPVVYLRKRSHVVSFHDEHWERMPSAGPGHVLTVQHWNSAPDTVSVIDTRMLLHTLGVGVQVWGIVGFTADHVTLIADGPVTGMPAFLLNGSAGGTGIRSTGLRIVDTLVRGPFRWTVTASGAYAGLGSLELSRVMASGPAGGVLCDDAFVQGAILGPYSVEDSVLPASSPVCGLLPGPL